MLRCFVKIDKIWAWLSRGPWWAPRSSEHPSKVVSGLNADTPFKFGHGPLFVAQLLPRNQELQKNQGNPL